MECKIHSRTKFRGVPLHPPLQHYHFVLLAVRKCQAPGSPAMIDRGMYDKKQWRSQDFYGGKVIGRRDRVGEGEEGGYPLQR